MTDFFNTQENAHYEMLQAMRDDLEQTISSLVKKIEQYCKHSPSEADEIFSNIIKRISAASLKQLIIEEMNKTKPDPFLYTGKPEDLPF